MEELIKEGRPINMVGVEGRKNLTREETKILNLVNQISNKEVKKTRLAHKKLLNLGKTISEKNKWKNP